MLGHDWQPAAGTVVDIRVKHPNSENDSRSWLVEVRCGDAEPFRIELGYPGFHEDFKGPGLGETVQVKADLKRKDAKWDLSDPALSWKADRSRQAAEFKAEKERPVLKAPGRPGHRERARDGPPAPARIANAEASGSAGGNDSLVGRLPQHLIAAVSLLRRPGPPAAARQYAGTCADLADDAGPVTETG